MSPDPDDDALRWEGDDDPTLAPGWKVVGKPAPLDAATDGTDAAASEPAVVDGPAPDTATPPRPTPLTASRRRTTRMPRGRPARPSS